MAAKVRKSKKHFRLDIIWDVDDEVSENTFRDLARTLMAMDSEEAEKAAKEGMTVAKYPYPCLIATEKELTDKQADRIYDNLTKE